MAMDHGQHGRRGTQFHNRGRRPDRRGHDRTPRQTADQSGRNDRVDVEQIMREIRTKIAQRSGVDLSTQQIQELAARRLEAILDPRSLNPGLLDQLRRAAGEKPAAAETRAAVPPPFEESILYDSPNGLLRMIRRLLQPFLRLFFNPSPVAHSLAVHDRMMAEAAARQSEWERRQTEWNALHYEILQRLVTEVARGSIDAQSLALRVESLSAKVDFNDRRVREMDASQGRPSRPPDAPVSQPSAPPRATAAGTEPQSEVARTQGDETPRRRRRRRRGRRGAGASGVPEGSAQGIGPEASPAVPEIATANAEGEEPAAGEPDEVPLPVLDTAPEAPPPADAPEE